MNSSSFPVPSFFKVITLLLNCIGVIFAISLVIKILFIALKKIGRQKINILAAIIPIGLCYVIANIYILSINSSYTRSFGIPSRILASLFMCGIYALIVFVIEMILLEISDVVIYSPWKRKVKIGILIGLAIMIFFFLSEKN